MTNWLARQLSKGRIVSVRHGCHRHESVCFVFFSSTTTTREFGCAGTPQCQIDQGQIADCGPYCVGVRHLTPNTVCGTMFVFMEGIEKSRTTVTQARIMMLPVIETHPGHSIL